MSIIQIFDRHCLPANPIISDLGSERHKKMVTTTYGLNSFAGLNKFVLLDDGWIVDVLAEHVS